MPISKGWRSCWDHRQSIRSHSSLLICRCLTKNGMGGRQEIESFHLNLDSPPPENERITRRLVQSLLKCPCNSMWKEAGFPLFRFSKSVVAVCDIGNLCRLPSAPSSSRILGCSRKSNQKWRIKMARKQRIENRSWP